MTALLVPTRRCALALAMAVAAALSGCGAFAPPRPWEKDVLARPEMQLDQGPATERTVQHIYASKEAASGGYGIGGGGCGCN